MAARYDVAARLTEGLPAADDLQIYVDACRLRGYQHPDLTARIRDSYTAEEGLDLRVLDADCAVLRGMAADGGEALRLARSQAAALADAWAGPGGTAASEFIVRQCDTAVAVDEAVRVAADACALLRDELWRLVDRRVSVTQEIAERARAAQPEWLAAAHAVLAGQAEQGDAGEIVDNQVTRFVDNAVRLDWLTAMRLADGNAVAAYRSAVDAVGSAPRVSFDVPGDFGPRYPDARPTTAPATAATALPTTTPALPSAPVALAGRSAVLPEEFSADLPGTVDGQPVVPAAVPPVSSPNPLDALASAPPLSPLNGLPGLGAPAMPDLGGGMGAPGRFADPLGSLLGAPNGTQMPDLLEVPELDVPDEPDALMDGEADADEGAAEEDAAGDDLEVADEEVDAEPDGTAEPAEPPTEGPAGYMSEDITESETGPTDSIVEPACDPPLPAPPPLPTEPGATPCEIAADELPQAGQ